MDIIRVLPDSVANQIAAGEVIQRPASVLKELVENSLDAGATRIQVIIHDAGRTLLQVVDNGKGMSRVDARVAFERHATSKIEKAQDLFALRTMGFRGEALASICAVSQVEMVTKTEADEVGTKLVLNGSQVVSQEPISCATGTNIKVKNLFFNIPVRRKFLKTAMTYYMLVMVLKHYDDEVLFDLPATNTKQRIEQVFSKSGRNLYTSQLVAIHAQTEVVTINGFVGKPDQANRTPRQYFFANGRFMKHPYFHKAVMNAYSGMLSAEAAPDYFIYMEVNPEEIDINIHPTKTEIKFAEEQVIFQILLATVREALGKFNVIPSLDFDVEGRIEMPLPRHDNLQKANIPLVVDTFYNPFKDTKPYTAPSFPAMPQQADMALEASQDNFPTAGWKQFRGRYLVSDTSEGLMLIHQSRAHALILYHTFMDELARHTATITQALLFPEIWELSVDDMRLVTSVLDDLKILGFDLSLFGPTAFSVNGIPASLGEANPIEALKHILACLKETGQNVKEQWHHRLALTLAYDAAIPVGKTLTEAEINDLISRLFALPTYRHMPDGKSIITVLTDEVLARYF